LCKQKASIIKRAAKLLEGFSDEEALRILRTAKKARAGHG